MNQMENNNNNKNNNSSNSLVFGRWPQTKRGLKGPFYKKYQRFLKTPLALLISKPLWWVRPSFMNPETKKSCRVYLNWMNREGRFPKSNFFAAYKFSEKKFRNKLIWQKIVSLFQQPSFQLENFFGSFCHLGFVSTAGSGSSYKQR